MVLTQSLSWGCSQAIGQGCSHPWLTDPFTQLLKSLDIVKLFVFFATCTSTYAWVFSWHGSWLLPGQVIQERERAQGSSHIFLQPNLRGDIPSLLLHSIRHIHQSWYSVGGDYTRVWIPGGGNHWGPSRRLATRLWSIQTKGHVIPPIAPQRQGMVYVKQNFVILFVMPPPLDWAQNTY